MDPTNPENDRNPIQARAPRSSSREARRAEAKKTQRKRILVAVLAVIGVGILGVAAYAAFGYKKMSDNIKAPVAEQKAAEQQLTAPPADPTKEPVYVLLLGVDKRPKEKYGRSDTMLLARVDLEKRQIKLLSIPRDSRVEIDGHGLDKINAAYQYGGAALAIKTVKQLTGLPVNHYISIDFQGFADVVDAMGGVWVNVDRSFTDINGANTGGVSNVTHIDKGFQCLDGDQALTYVRARHPFADGDFTRMRHQQEFLAAIAKQAVSVSNLPKLPAIGQAASKNMQSDMSLSALIALAGDIKGISKESIKSYTLPAQPKMIGGISYMILNQANCKILISDFQAGRESTVTAY